MADWRTVDSPCLKLICWIMFQLTGAELPTLGSFRFSCLLLKLMQLFWAPKIPHAFVGHFYTTTKGADAPHQNEQQKTVSLSRISVDFDVKVRGYGGQNWERLVPYSLEDSFLVCLHRLAGGLTMIPYVKDVDHRVC